jgi:hypothetical protein
MTKQKRRQSLRSRPSTMEKTFEKTFSPQPTNHPSLQTHPTDPRLTAVEEVRR